MEGWGRVSPPLQAEAWTSGDKKIMVASVSNASARALPAALPPIARANAPAQPREAAPNAAAKAAPSLKSLDAQAFGERKQIAAALYDRSFTFAEAGRALKTQDGLAAYAARIQTAPGGPSDKDLAQLSRALDRAEAQIQALSRNEQGANLASPSAIDGRTVDLVQENLANRIRAGLKDGSLTAEEGEALTQTQTKLSELEKSLRESGGRLTAGEQKQLLDQLRESASAINKARSNDIGVRVTQKTYADQIDARQASLEKQLANGIKIGSLTEKEAETVRAQFAAGNALENELGQDGRIDGRDAIKLTSALDRAEIALYDLQRNKDGVQLAERYVDRKAVDLRASQQLESLANGLSNKSLTNDEAQALLNQQQAIQNQEARLVASGDGLTRSEFLQLRIAQNDFALQNQDLQRNSARYSGLIVPTKAAAIPESSPANNNESGIAAGPAPALAIVSSTPANPAPSRVEAAQAARPENSPIPASTERAAETAPALAAAPAEVAAPALAPANGPEGNPLAALKGNGAPVKNPVAEGLAEALKALNEKAAQNGQDIAARAREAAANEKSEQAAKDRAAQGNTIDQRVQAYAKVQEGVAPSAKALSLKVA